MAENGIEGLIQEAKLHVSKNEGLLDGLLKKVELSINIGGDRYCKEFAQKQDMFNKYEQSVYALYFGLCAAAQLGLTDFKDEKRDEYWARIKEIQKKVYTYRQKDASKRDDDANAPKNNDGDCNQPIH